MRTFTLVLLRIAMAALLVFVFFMTIFTVSIETHRSHVCHRAGGVYVLTWLTGFKCIKVNGVIVVNE